MRNGYGVWYCADLCWDNNPENPTKYKGSHCPVCGSSRGFAAYNTNRVRGSSYEYYKGNDPWIRSANEQMKQEANCNFRKGK